MNDTERITQLVGNPYRLHPATPLRWAEHPEEMPWEIRALLEHRGYDADSILKTYLGDRTKADV